MSGYLSSRQRTILRAIRDTTERTGSPPTWRELREVTGLSRPDLVQELDLLFLEGYLE